MFGTLGLIGSSGSSIYAPFQFGKVIQAATYQSMGTKYFPLITVTAYFNLA